MSSDPTSRWESQFKVPCVPYNHDFVVSPGVDDVIRGLFVAFGTSPAWIGSSPGAWVSSRSCCLFVWFGTGLLGLLVSPRTAGLTRYDHDEAIRTSGINGEDLTKNWPKSCLNQGSIRGKSGLKVDKTRNMKKQIAVP